MDDIELIEKAKRDDNEAFEQLINSYRRMIFSIINKKYIKYNSVNLSKDDLYQEACISFYEACKRFDPKRNVKFSSFAYRVISCRLNKVISKTTAIQKNELYIIDNINEENMKKNKIIPFLGLIAVPAITMPVVTSCSKTYVIKVDQ